VTAPGPAGPPVEYEPALVEAAVLVAAGSDARRPELRQGRDACYAVADPDAREEAFRALFAGWFERLGLGAPLQTALAEQPGLARVVERCVVAGVAGAAVEGGELHGAGAMPGPPVALLRMRPRTLADPGEALAFFRRELTHLGDLVDPAFGYATEPLGGSPGAGPEALLRGRYRVAWAVSVAGRLAQRGWLRPGEAAARQREFAAAFAMLGSRAAEVFARVWDGTVATHAALSALAREPERTLGVAGRGPGPGERCPVCGGPTHAFVADPARLPAPVLARLRASLPRWRPDDGLCQQCADLFAARAGVLAAAPRPALAEHGSPEPREAPAT
jgi:hypothetical protein